MKRPPWWTVLCDANGQYSSKRVAAFVALEAFVSFSAKGVYDGHDIQPAILTGLVTIIVGGLGFAVVEWFSPRARQCQEQYNADTVNPAEPGGAEVPDRSDGDDGRPRLHHVRTPRCSEGGDSPA